MIVTLGAEPLFLFFLFDETNEDDDKRDDQVTLETPSSPPIRVLRLKRAGVSCCWIERYLTEHSIRAMEASSVSFDKTR